MKKQRLNRIDANEFRQEKGQIIIPDGYELYKVPTRLERLHAEIKRLEKELEGMKEPTQEELIEEGRDRHYYYEIIRMLDFYNKDLQAYNELIKTQR